MPELPEVETTVRGITPAMLGEKVTGIQVRNASLRWPVPTSLSDCLTGKTVTRVGRRAKYILISVEGGTVLMHLGMSGSLRLVPALSKPEPHDHFDIEFDNGLTLRFRDPRKFGCVLWVSGNPAEFHLLRNLGPEPLGEDFTAPYLHKTAKSRRVAVKNLIMNARVVVGVGNIYASEALFRAGIHPARQAGRISITRYHRLVRAIQETLNDALTAGGTTLRDFFNERGEPGYFEQQLKVYGREGMACPNCGGMISKVVIAKRSTYFCKACQR